MGDADLVALAAGGDRDAFAALYDRHAPAVHDYLRRMLGNPHDAADALQDTFLAAGTRIHQLRDPTKVRAWLYAIARRHAYKATAARRRTEPFDPLEDGDVSVVDVDPTDALADEELRTLVDAAAEGLDERDRSVLELHFRHGLGGDELADALGIERNNAHVLVHRVKERLQTSLGALVVARHGRSACSDLALILGGWDGRLSTVVRKRIARHADGCETCGATMERGMRPAALLGVVPLVPLPAGARELVLDRVELCSYTGEPWPGDDGFPPGDDRPIGDGSGDDDGSRRRASRVLVGALVAVLLFLVAGSVVLADADRVDRGLTPAGAEEEETTSSGRRGTTSRPTSTSSTAATSSTIVEDPSTPTTRRPTTPTTRRPGTRPPTATTTPPAPETTDPPTTATTAPTTTTRPPTTTTRPPPTTTTTRPPTTTTQPPPPPPTTTTTIIIIG